MLNWKVLLQSQNQIGQRFEIVIVPRNLSTQKLLVLTTACHQCKALFSGKNWLALTFVWQWIGGLRSQSEYSTNANRLATVRMFLFSLLIIFEMAFSSPAAQGKTNLENGLANLVESGIPSYIRKETCTSITLAPYVIVSVCEPCNLRLLMLSTHTQITICMTNKLETTSRTSWTVS